MKKTFGKVLVALLVTVAFAVLVGCKNNADSGTAIDNRLLGTWEISVAPDNAWAAYIAWLPKTVTCKADMTAPAYV